MRLGTLVVAMPQFGERKPCISSVLMGERNMVITRVLAEHLATAFNRIVLVSTHLRETKESEVGPVLLRLVHRLLEKTGKEE